MWFFLINFFICIIGIFIQISKIGKERKPIAPQDCIVSIIMVTLYGISTFILWTNL